MYKNPTLTELIVGLLSLIIFIYRIIVIMLPMLKEGIKEKNQGKIFNSLTLLV